MRRLYFKYLLELTFAMKDVSIVLHYFRIFDLDAITPGIKESEREC